MRGRAAAISAICALLSVLACRGTTGARQGSAASAVAPDISGGPRASADAGPPSGANPLAITNTAPGEFALLASATLEVDQFATIESLNQDGGWAAYEHRDDGDAFRLVETCSPRPRATSPCTQLSAGQVFVPVPWTGYACGAQCAPPCSSATFQAGVHRLVVKGCGDPAVRFEGDPFEMPASSAILARWRAASRVEAATLVRLDPRKTANPEIPQPNYIAGFGSASAPEAMAPNLLTELVRWLRSTEGFNDSVVKRCARAHMVGILLVQRPPVGSTKAIEIAIDFACNSVSIAGDLGRGRVVLSSFFDSSRGEVLSILKRAIPLDHEIGGLR